MTDNIKKPIILQNPEMTVTTYTYKEEFLFQRLQKDQRWYVTYQNQIIGHGMYRHDLEEWIDSAYFSDGNKIKKEVINLIADLANPLNKPMKS